jgi:hypothetical protein
LTAFSTDFRAAKEDYAYLLDKGYAAKSSLKIVGDRRRLDAEERIILFRGVAPQSEAAARRAKLGLPPRDSVLLVDLYNVAFTLVHYLIGKPCFICTDGLLRDAGANYGRVPHEAELARAFSLLAACLGELGPRGIEAYLDAPVTRSGEHAAAFRALLDAAHLALAIVETARSADLAILARLPARGGPAPAHEVWVLSSDSVLVDRAPSVFDAARHILETSFEARFLRL